MADAFVFKESAFRRTANVVRTVERWRKDRPGVDVPPPNEAADGEQVRLGTISATWNKGSTATVTQIKGDGDAMSRTIEFTAYNWFSTVTVASGTAKVACARVGPFWVLIGIEHADGCLSVGGQDLSSVTGYDSTKTQVLGQADGCLAWIDTTTCDSGSS